MQARPSAAGSRITLLFCSVSQKLVTATRIKKASLRSHSHGCCQEAWEGCVELGRWWLEVGCHTVEGAGFRTRLVVERNVANVWKGQHAWVKEQESRKGLGRLTTHGCASCNSSPLLNHAWQPLITTGCEGLDECALAYSSALCIAGSMYHSKISPAGTALATHGHASSARCDCDHRVAALSCLRHSEDRMSYDKARWSFARRRSRPWPVVWKAWGDPRSAAAQLNITPNN